MFMLQKMFLGLTNVFTKGLKIDYYKARYRKALHLKIFIIIIMFMYKV